MPGGLSLFSVYSDTCSRGSPSFVEGGGGLIEIEHTVGLIA